MSQSTEHVHGTIAFPKVAEESHWPVYEKVIDACAKAGIPVALGGAFGLATYTGEARSTKDLDLYVLPHDRHALIDIVTRLGMTDYYDEKPYDREWIYRATADDGIIVDIIWAMANHRAKVDGWWMSGPTVRLRGRRLKVLPAETMLWDKLYILQKERCDWPDVMKLLYFHGEKLAWRELLGRLEDDLPLLTGALAMFRWLSPGVSAKFPEWLWGAVNLPAQPRGRELEIVPERVARLDTRPWYARTPVVKKAG